MTTAPLLQGRGAQYGPGAYGSFVTLKLPCNYLLATPVDSCDLLLCGYGRISRDTLCIWHRLASVIHLPFPSFIKTLNCIIVFPLYCHSSNTSIFSD